MRHDVGKPSVKATLFASPVWPCLRSRIRLSLALRSFLWTEKSPLHESGVSPRAAASYASPSTHEDPRDSASTRACARPHPFHFPSPAGGVDLVCGCASCVKRPSFRPSTAAPQSRGAGATGP